MTTTLKECVKHSLFDVPISKFIWNEKYRLKTSNGDSNEVNYEDSHIRVVNAVYKNEEDSIYETSALDAMCAGDWVPAGRIHAGAGSDKRVTLINCYVSPTIEDSMKTHIDKNSKGIMDSLTVAALTQQMGGGIGMNFDLRPRGAVVQMTGSVSSGNLHFMDMWDAMCATIMSSGTRRGAMMATMFCHHPDLLEFIEAKHQQGRLTNFNISVLMTDAFMVAVRNNADWDLYYHVPPADGKCVRVFKEQFYDGSERDQFVYYTMSARELFDKITRSTYEYAEPGVIFIDRINELNNLNYCEDIKATNPCGEQPLPPNSDCNLGAINLATMVIDPFVTPTIDWDRLKRTIKIGVRFLDNVIDITKFPTVEQELEAIQKRRIGLGITGLANMLQQMKVRYGSDEAVTLTKRIMKFIRDHTYSESIALGNERGAFPAFQEDKYLSSPFIKSLSKTKQENIRKYGIRNSVLLTIAPTGTTSLYYGNVSSGCEPSFAFSYYRKVRAADGFEEFQVEDYGYKSYCEYLTKQGKDVPADEQLPDYMVTAHDLTVDEHLVMQAACQEFVDSSISKTINCPKEISFEDFQEVYQKAYDMGCKGCTTYRPSDVRGSVLSIESKDKEPEKQLDKIDVIPRSPILEGKTYKVRWPAIDHAFYVTINDYIDDEGVRRPFEIFINSKTVQHQEWIAALTLLVSAVFRKGGDVSFLVDELEQVHATTGGYFLQRKYVPSIVAHIGSILRTHMQQLGLIDKDSKDHTITEDILSKSDEKGEIQKLIGAEICPKCEAPTFIHSEGCQTCASCGYSNCS